MPDLVTHFEIFADDPAKLVDFYHSLFGWEIEKAPGIDYWRIRIEAAGAIGGGLTHRAIPETRSWVHYVHVASLDEAVAEALRLGGKVVRPKTAVPKTAWYAVLTDPQGNVFAVWQTDPAAMPPPVPE